mmetsp:Transcript_12870/g.19490  ORF Transcript_12870/g.19490 Transcript_12870/m.19490 type:complete len:136 (+) Transcript_12870:21-428(+)
MASLALATRRSSLNAILRASAGSTRISAASSTTTASFSSTKVTAEDKSVYNLTKQPSPYSLGKHRSNALELIQKQPVIEVEGDMAVCDGGGGVLGHPLEYIKVGNRADYESPEDYEKGVACIYCGLRYRKKSDGH